MGPPALPSRRLGAVGGIHPLGALRVGFEDGSSQNGWIAIPASADSRPAAFPWTRSEALEQESSP